MTTTRSSILLAAVLAALVAVTAATAQNKQTTLTGAGSTFVQPLVSTWTPALASAFGFDLQYSGVGSGAGIAAISSRSADFGASDAPLTADQLAACHGCVQIPWALGATSVAYNVPGAPAHLHLSGKAVADIFLGKVTSWDDPELQALNEGAKLPRLKITPVFRSDGSGTSYNFTDYLSAVSPEWKSKIGVSTQPSFPTGVGAKGSGGVAGVVTSTPGAVTYVDVAYALKNHISFAAIRTSAGKYVYPSLRRVVEAGAAIESVPASNELHIVAPSRKFPTAYPISTFTYVILPLQTPHAAQLRKLVFWALTQGQQGKYTAKLLFAPIPKTVLVAAEKTLKRVHS